MTRKLYLLCGTLLTLLWWGCAQQLAPQGGAKDLAPPELLDSDPPNYSTHFNSKKIELTFNEFIQVKSPKENLVISPVLKYEPQFLIKGKDLIITIEDTLKEHTTYVFNFNEALVDITEANPLQGFRYIFSTGNHIDSLKLTGSVINAFTLAPENNIVIMLYDSDQDSLPYNEPPRYIGKSNAAGRFEISNLKKGAYKVFALGDKNRNYLYDPDQELIGFSDTMVYVGTDSISPEVHMKMFREEPSRQYLKRYASKEQGRFMLKYNLPPENLTIRELNGQLEDRRLLKESNPKGDSLLYWIAPPDNIDTLRLEVTANDTLTDTLFISILPRNKKWKNAKVSSNANSTFDLNASLTITSELPATLDTTRIRLLLGDSTEVPATWQPVDSAYRKYEAKHKWGEQTEYALKLLPGAVKDVQGFENDSLSFYVISRERKYYGTLKLAVKGLTGPGILELSKKGEVVDTTHINPMNNQLYFEYLPPGDYNLKIIHDTNENAQWDSGNYLKKRFPEKVTIYNGIVTIRSNWDQELEWQVD